MLTLLLCLMTLGASAQPKGFQNSAFGQCGNVTGGAGGAVKIISDGSVSSLEAAMKASGKAIIIITKNITFTNHLSVQVKDKTILAMPGVKLISEQQNSSTSGILYIKSGSSNVIFRNLTFEGPGAYDCDGWDNLCFDGVTNAWVDHCDFQDGCDGNFDNKGNTDNITISWCRFHYLKPAKAGGSGGSADHRFTNLIGSSSSAKPTDGRYTMTWAYCWWDEGCRERMPRVRNADLHMLNDVWTSSVANYYVGPENAAAVFDGCWFGSSKNVFKSYGGTNHVKYNGCYSKAGVSLSNSGTTANISYSYSVLSYTDAYNAVTNTTTGAGATLKVNQSTGECTAGDGSTSGGSGSGSGSTTTTYTITASAGTGGTATVDKNSVAAGGTATFTATPNSGYAFVGWTNSNGSTVSTSNPYTATNINANTSLKANFQSQTACAITSCTVYGSAATISGTNITATVPYTAPTSGIVVNITLSDGATSSVGTSFTKTLAADEGATNSQTIIVTAKDGSTKQTYTLTIKRAGNATVLDVRGGSVAAGGNFTNSSATTDQKFTSGTEVSDGTDVSSMSGNTGSVYRSSDALSITIGNLPSSVSSITFGATSSGSSERTVTGVAVNGVAASGYAVDGTVADKSTVHRVTISGLNASAGSSITITMSGNTHFYYFELVGATATPVVKSSNADLSALKYNGVSVPDFNSNTTTYNIELPAGTTMVPSVAYTLSDTKASATVNSASALPGVTTVKVTAEDGTTTKTYTINYTVAVQPDASDPNIPGGQPSTGEGTISYNLTIGTAANHLSSTDVASSENITNLVGITAPAQDGEGKSNLTVKINGGENNSAMVGFTVKDGFKFIPSSVSVKVQPVGTSSSKADETNTVRLVLSDGVNTIEGTYQNIEGKITTNVMENTDNVALSGAVTLNIYSYGDCPTYRLGSPILIQGEITEGIATPTSLVITDQTTSVPEASFEAGNVSYTRNTVAGKYGSFCLPFTFNVENTTCFDNVYIPVNIALYNTSTGMLKIFLKKAKGEIAAGMPFIARCSGATMVVSSEAVAYNSETLSNPEPIQMKTFNSNGSDGALIQNENMEIKWCGTFTATDKMDGMMSFNTNGSFGVHNGATLGAFRAYLLQTIISSAKISGIEIDFESDEATAIENIINSHDASSSVYNLQGIRMDKGNMAPGIYIINGRKVIRK